MDLHVTSPLMNGPEVLRAQRLLTVLGFSPGPIDGVYGPTTATSVKAFQSVRKLNADGVVNETTFAALLNPESSAGPKRVASGIGTAALREAVKHLGVKESPPHSNRTPFGVWFGVDGIAWCNVFVSYCFQVGAGYTICDGFNGSGCRAGKGCAYVPTTESWLRAMGFWVGRTDPCPGDIAILNWDGGAPDHIGIVESNLGEGQVQTIEGNASATNNSNGGEVVRRHRHLTQISGFGRIP